MNESTLNEADPHTTIISPDQPKFEDHITEENLKSIESEHGEEDNTFSSENNNFSLNIESQNTDLMNSTGYDHMNGESLVNNYALQDFQMQQTTELHVVDSIPDSNYSSNQFNSQVNLMQKPVNFVTAPNQDISLDHQPIFTSSPHGSSDQVEIHINQSTLVPLQQQTNSQTMQSLNHGVSIINSTQGDTQQGANPNMTWNVSASRPLHAPHTQIPMPMLPQAQGGMPNGGSNYMMQLPGQSHQMHQASIQNSANSANPNYNGGSKFPPPTWHSSEHIHTRTIMVEEIIKLLKNRRPNATEDWHEKLPHMAKRLEDALYHDAPSVDAYADQSTLKMRLQHLALSMGGSKGNNNPQQQQQQGQRSQMPVAQMNMMNNANPGVNMNTQNRITPQMQQQMQHQMNSQQFNGVPPYSQQLYNHQQARTAQAVASQYPHVAQNIPMKAIPPNNQVPNMNNNFGSTNDFQTMQMHNNNRTTASNMVVPGNDNYMVMNNSMAIAQRGYPPQGGNNPQQQTLPNQMMTNYMLSNDDPLNSFPGYGSGAMMTSGANQIPGHVLSQHPAAMQIQSQNPLQLQGQQLSLLNAQGQNHPDDHRKQVLKQQQQRLLLLRHASKCSHDNGRCPVTPHCWNMKQLWKHIMACKDQECKIPHCVSSRYVLSHYSKCKEQQCPVCGPVREAIKRNYQRSQDVVKMTRGDGKSIPGMGMIPLTVMQNGLVPMNGFPMGGPSLIPNQPSLERNADLPPSKRQKKEKVGTKKERGKEAEKEKYREDESYLEKDNSSIGKDKVATKEKGKEKMKKEKSKDKATAEKDKVERERMERERIERERSDRQEREKEIEEERERERMDRERSRIREELLMKQQQEQNSKPKDIFPLDSISCAIYNFSPEQIKAHFESIQEGLKMNATKIKEMCKPILEEILRIPHTNGVFGSPVDPVSLGLPDYFEVVKFPMDLGTVMKRLDVGSYRDLHYFVQDVHLTFDNAMTYNPKNSDVYVLAKTLKREFDNKYRSKYSEFIKSIEAGRNNIEACLICGETSLKFEPPVYYCNGTCGQRIRRNAVMYSNSANSYHWCSPCFNSLKDSQTIRLPDCNISKTELANNKKKHVEESEEGWVQCDGGCQRWVHQVCSLFNARRNISDDVHYVCPNCIQDKRKKCPDVVIVQPTTKKMKASDLPYSTLSKFLEDRIYRRLQIAYEENAQKLGVSVNDVEKCPPLILRQVSCLDKAHVVRDGVYQRYKDKNYPVEFPCRTKCLVLFQNIDGQDIILFGMYVYEYGHKCPQPNQRRVYVSYLDSVHYLRPKQYRTLVYHEILVSYLDYVKARGFHTAHIWACPPQKGDDYILYVHPPDQKTPKPQILRVWYDEMLKLGKERGVVHEIVDIHTEYMLDPSNDATVLPYFEGDYWVNEAEVIIKDLKEGKGKEFATATADDDKDIDNDLSNKSKRKSKTKRPTRTSSKPLLGGKERDPVMAKLASIIEPMKDTFFVARLHPKEFANKYAETRVSELSNEQHINELENQHEMKLQEDVLSNNNDTMMSGIATKSEFKDPSSNIIIDVIKSDQEEVNNEAMKELKSWHSSDHFQLREETKKEIIKFLMKEKPQASKDLVDKMPVMAVRLESALYDSAMSLDEYNDNSSLYNRIQSLKNTVLNTSPLSTSAVSSSSSTRSTRGQQQQQLKLIQDDNRSGVAEEPMDISEAIVKEEPTTTESMVNSEDPVVVADQQSQEIKIKEETIESITAVDVVVSNSIESKENEELDNNDNNVVLESENNDIKKEPLEMKKVLIMSGEDMPEFGDDTEDVDDIQECEHFDTRQSFLNLCQGNHYQFDQLRRAKHTSMMVLYHLHNPDAPKFVPSCHVCHVDILAGYRFHCESCEIDFCQTCVTNTGQKIHNHQLRPVAVATSTPTPLTEEQRKERQRSIQLHMQLLQHSANCVECKSKNCLKMKEFLKHDSICKIKSIGGCRLCQRISNLLGIHSRSCKLDNCKVPHCADLREQQRKLSLRQQQMDDRRRKKMNFEYNRTSVDESNREQEEGEED